MTNGIRTTLTETRIKVCKGDMTIVNLSLLFSLIALLCAPWLVILGVVAALALGYRITITECGKQAANTGASAPSDPR